MKLIAFANRSDKLVQALTSGRLAKALFIHRVLAGAEHRQMLDARLATVVAARGFRLVGMYNPAYDAAGQVVQADFLFRRG